MLFVTTLLCLLAIPGTLAKKNNKVCAALGPSYPKPSNLNSFPSFQKALKDLDNEIDAAIETGKTRYGEAHFSNTTFSLSIYSLYDDGLLWQRHHTDASVRDSPDGTHHVDADTIYQIGSVSKMITMYILLILDGDKSFTDPVSKYLPQLLQQNVNTDKSNGALPQWDQISIGDLATHIGGINDDYGLDDDEFYLGASATVGYPPLPTSRIPTCNYGFGRRYVPCTVSEIVKGLSTEAALWTPGITPSYANAGYDLIGATIESIAGVTLSQSFKEAFVEPLGLKHTFFYPPNDTSFAAIPVGEWKSQYIVPLAATIPDGGYFVSSNDFSTIGKSILNSTLLSVPLTRRWLKPRMFTSNPTNFVGAPWEIFRWETPTRLWDIYTKEGEVGAYSTMFVIIPDLDIGFTAFTTGAVERSAAVEILANVLTGITLPAAQEVARQQSDQNFGGRYSTTQINSSLVITTDEQPGLKVAEWISNGTNFVWSGYDFRLWPNFLYTGNQVGFTMSMEPLFDRYRDVPLNEQCTTWGDLGANQWGNTPVGSFVFEVDEGTGKASNVRLEAFSLTLEKEQ